MMTQTSLMQSSLGLGDIPQSPTIEVQELTHQLNDAISRGSYDEANFLKEQLQELKQNFEATMMQVLEADHEEQLMTINQTYQDEQSHFNEIWEQRLDEFNAEARMKLDQLKDQLKEELQAMEQKYVERPVRFSSQLIELRNTEARCARNGEFENAKRAEKMADELEMREVAERDCENEFEKEQQRLRLVQKFEKMGKILKQKVEAARAETLAMWAADMDKIEKHYQALIRMEEQRYGVARNEKQLGIDYSGRNQAAGGNRSLRGAESLTERYVNREGSKVDTRRLGSSMSPVMSKECGLAALRDGRK